VPVNSKAADDVIEMANSSRPKKIHKPLKEM
jgi:hypothetical protein